MSAAKASGSRPGASTSKKARGKPKAFEAVDDLEAIYQSTLAAIDAAAASSSKPTTSGLSTAHFTADEDVLLFDEDAEDDNDEEEVKRVTSKSSAETKQNGKGQPISRIDDKGKAKAIDSHLARLESGQALEDLRASKGRRAAARQGREDRAQTAGSKWFDLPAFPKDDKDPNLPTSGPSSATSRYSNSAKGPTAEEMRREVQAIRLRNALDPKRFYKGGASKDRGMPEFAQLGRIISGSLEGSRQTLNKKERGTSVVDELIKDAQAASYAKRKYAEHQVKTSAGGKGHYKAKTRKPNDRKRQRK